jgi:HK97 family phage major capsid protein
VTPVIASGSAANDGLSETGVNSLGSQDFAAAIGQLNQAYLESPKVAWFMNSATLAKVRGIVTKQGSLLELVKDTDDGPYIYGVKVRICPSMPNIGASNVPVILGDGSYFCTKLVLDAATGIKIYREATGLVEQGLVQMVSFVRAGSTLLYNDTNSPSPFIMIQNHS